MHNVGYLVAGVLHPGTRTWTPRVPTSTCCAHPIGAPWLKLGDVVDYVRSVRPRRAVVVHDAMLSAIGQGMAINLLGRLGGAGAPVALDPGDGIDV